MKTFTYQDIESWGPCYDPVEHISIDWKGTAIDVLRMDTVTPEDRLWVVLREECIDATTLRLFAAWCARQALALVQEPDPRSLAACDVAERYANGQASKQELDDAYYAAYAAYDAADARAARPLAPCDAAAARAARAARAAAAYNAADDTADDAAYNAYATVRALAYGYSDYNDVDAVRQKQVEHLIKMLSK